MKSALNAPGLMAGPPLVSFAHREPIVVPQPVQNVNVDRLKEAINGVDQSSLMPTCMTRSAHGTSLNLAIGLQLADNRSAPDVWYTLCLVS